MSLLLEALKKAEKAKEEAQRRAGAEAAAPAAVAPGGAAAERKPLLTRDKLPDISTPLEIVGDDLEAGRASAGAPALELEPALKPAEPPPGAAPAAAAA